MLPSVSPLSRYPVLRLLLPLVAGILAFELTQSRVLPLALAGAALAAWLFVAWGSKGDAMRRYRYRWAHVIPVALAMAAVGWFSAWIACPPALDVARLGGTTATGRILEVKFYERSMQMQVELISSGGSIDVSHSVIQLSTRDCNYELSEGDLIAFPLKLSEIRNLGNPDEPDYAAQMRQRGIRYRSHIPVGQIARVGHTPTLMTRVTGYRKHLERLVLSSGVSERSQQLAIAMLLGNDDYIDAETRSRYSLAGVAHVLALSGLHLSIISLLIWYLLFPLDYAGGKKVRLAVTMLLLAGYAVLTGLSASVVRSALMIGMSFTAVILGRRWSPLNAVFVAAFVILLFSPGSLFSAGFQLSFVTVAAMILFYMLSGGIRLKNRVLNYVAGTLAASAVALAASVILSGYYFSTLSGVGAVANVVIVPLLPALMLTGAVWLALLAMGGALPLLGDCLDALTWLLDRATSWFAGIGMSSRTVYVSGAAVWLYYATLAAIVLWLYRGKARWLLTAGCVLAVWLAHSAWVEYNVPRRGMVIFNSFNSTPVLCYDHGRSLLWVPDVEADDYDVAAFRERHRRFLSHYRIDSVELVGSVPCRLPQTVIAPPHAMMGGRGYVAVGHGSWKHSVRADSTAVIVGNAIVTKRYHSTIAKLRELYGCDTVILSGAFYEEDAPALVAECDSMGVPCVNLRDSGALMRRY